MQCPRCDRKLAPEDRFCSRCGLSRSLDGEPVDPLIGLTVSDRYRIEERIGVGGMGTVYRAQHVRFGQDVAIKVLHERYTGDQKLARRFEKEAMTYGQVSHPNLVGLHDFGRTPDGMFYMALEYCPGKPLSTLLRERRRFDWRLATDVVMQVRAQTAAFWCFLIAHSGRTLRSGRRLPESRSVQGGRQVGTVDCGGSRHDCAPSVRVARRACLVEHLARRVDTRCRHDCERGPQSHDESGAEPAGEDRRGL